MLMKSREATFEKLKERIIFCQKCSRLTSYISEVARVKVPKYSDWSYWGRPLPGFGDPDAKLLIIGLAPAAHGGNRTGRMFTGNSSGDWLIKVLYETGFSNQAISISRDDGLKLTSAYITATVRCAPPGNKPTIKEIENCSQYLLEEIQLLKEVEVVLALGRISFDTYIKYMCPRNYKPKPHFQHGMFYSLKGMPTVAASYHPSRQNTQTGKLTWDMWLHVFKEIRCLLERR